MTAIHPQPSFLVRIVERTTNRLKELVLGDRTQTTSESLDEVEALVHDLDYRFRQFIPVFGDAGLFGFVNYDTKTVHWVGRIEEFEHPVPETFVLGQ